MSTSRPPGPRRKQDIDPDRLILLEAGVAESRTHVEQMALSFSRLLGSVFPGHTLEPALIDGTPFIARLRLVGRLLLTEYGASLFRRDREFVSDTVRGWCAMALSERPELSLGAVVDALEPFACDHHFAVREWAWLAIRPRVVANVDEALAELASCFMAEEPLLRRFAVEATRPRSVWGAHVGPLKQHPETAEAVLDNFRCEPDRYVRVAVGNWLNDASRTRRDWVEEITSRWSQQCACDATTSIVVRGTRSTRPLS